MRKKIAIIGAGGHGKVVGEIALLNNYKTINFFDNRASKIKQFPFTISGTFKDLIKNINDYESFFVAIGENKLRFEMIESLREYDLNFVNLLHPSSTVSKFSSLGVGICIMANAVVNAGTIIKEGAIINTSSSVDHDCLIEDYAHISPNSTLSGGVRIGKFTHLGSGTSVHPEINIGKNVKIGVGSKIFKDILDDTIFKN